MVPSVPLALLSTFALIAVAGAAPPPDRAPAPDRNPTMGDLRDLYGQGDYPRLLQQLSRTLALRGEAAKGYERYELLVLKGEGHLQLKNVPESAQAFDEAARVAPDEQAAALARSMAALVRRANGPTYAPPGIGGQPAPAPIDLRDRAQRTAAFRALYEERAPKATADSKAAVTSGNLQRVLDGLGTLFELRSLELAGTGGDTKSAALAASLTGKASSLMAQAVSEMSKAVAEVEEATVQTYELATRSGGASLAHRRQLMRIADDCDRIVGVAADLRMAFPGDEPNAFNRLGENAADVATWARSVAGFRWMDGGKIERLQRSGVSQMRGAQ